MIIWIAAFISVISACFSFGFAVSAFMDSRRFDAKIGRRH